MRTDVLKMVLKQTMDNEGIDKFLGYPLSLRDIEFIKQTAQEVPQKMPATAFNCAHMSAIWAAMIEDHSTIPVAFISGNLNFGQRIIFKCKSPIPVPDENKTIQQTWDGHCWLEFGGLVADISIFRSIRFGNVPLPFSNHLRQTFGPGRGMLCLDDATLKSKQLFYTPCYSATKTQIDALINGMMI